MLASAAFLGPEELKAVADRIRRGELLRPTSAMRDRARELLHGVSPPPASLGRGHLALLAMGNLLFTPLLGYAVWFRFRRHPGPGARQALLVTLPVTALLAVGWWMLRLRQVAHPADLLDQ